jgi:hypothetical protein
MHAKQLIAVVCVGLSSCVTPPSRVVVHPGSHQGLILVEIDPQNTAFAGEGGALVTPRLGYFLTFSRYPHDASADAPPALGDWVHVNMPAPGKTSARFYAEPAPAGTYVLEALNVGGGVSWGSCFNKATVAFDVRAGEVVYLGELSPRPVFEDLSANLPGALQIGTYRYVFDRSAPAFTTTQLTAQKSAEITEFLKRVYPQVDAPVRLGTLRPATFRSGKPSALARFPRCASTD